MGFWQDFVLKLREQLQKSWLGKLEKLYGRQQFLKIQEEAPKLIIGRLSMGLQKKVHGHLDENITSV